MREILFKAKRIDNDEWVEGWYDGCYSTVTINYLENGYAYNVRVDPETVCEFTGLLDKNGGRIFEGDILQMDDDVFVVDFNEGCYYAREGNSGNELSEINLWCDIRGNIHNKEDREDYGLNE